MKAKEYLEQNSDWFDKSPGGEKLYFESEVIKMMENYSYQKEISDEEIEEESWRYREVTKDMEIPPNEDWSNGAKWYREQLKKAL